MIANANDAFLNSFNTILKIIQAESIINMLQKNYQIVIPQDLDVDTTVEALLVPVVQELFSLFYAANTDDIDGYCDCEMSTECVVSFALTDKDFTTGITTRYYSFRNYYSGCYIVTALLPSALSCFFDIDCVDFITSVYVSYETLPLDLQPLDESKLIASTVNTRVRELLNNLFVEQWNSTMNYSGFYEACSPLSCTYSFTNRNGFLYILSEALGIIGGLVTILSIIVPNLTRIIMQKLARNAQRMREVETTEIPNEKWFRRLWKFAINEVNTFNLFRDSIESTDQEIIEYEMKNGQIATKLLFILVFIITLIISLYLRLTTETKIISIEKPTRSIYDELIREHGPTNLDCRCTNIAVSYNQTIRLDPTYHPLCQSQYEVQWQSTYNNYMNNDSFENMIIYFFQRFPPLMSLAKELCALAEEKVTNGLNDFYSRSLISTQLFPIDLLKTQAESATQTFINNLGANFLLTIDIMNAIIQNNHLVSAKFINWGLFYFANDTRTVGHRAAKYDNCSCNSLDYLSCASTMVMHSRINDNAPKIPVPGIIASCSQIESLKKSSLELFFNRTAFDKLIEINFEYAGFAANQNISLLMPLNPSKLGSAHQVNTTVAELLADLFIEEWNFEVLFDDYFDACIPASCSYQIIVHHSSLYVVTFVFSLIGGLVAVLRLTLLPLVQFIRRKSKPRRRSFQQSIFLQMKLKVLKLDLFSKKNETNLYKRQNGILSTRVYTIAMGTLLVILGLSNAINEYSTLLTIENPTETEYNQIYRDFPDSIQCPCKTETFSYETFIQLEPQSHPICTSELLIDVYRMIDSETLSALVRSLHDLCQLANRTVDQSLAQFLHTQYISMILVSPDRLQSQVEVFIDEFISETLINFIQKLNSTMNYIRSNQLLSVLQTNYEMLLYESISSVATQPKTYANGQCDCYSNYFCSEDSPELPGFRIGCYLIEALRQSNLHCFFNETCMFSTFKLNQTLIAIPVPMSINELLNNLFIIDWRIEKLNYTNYFDVCQPTSCTYLFIGQRNLLLVITIMIGIFGGLSNVLQLIVPTSIKLIRRIYDKLRQRSIRIAPQ